MKKLPALLCLLALLPLCLSTCGQRSAEPSAPLPPAAPADTISFEGTVFQFNESTFDIAQRDPSVNAIMDCTVLTPHVIVEGHIGPKNGYYGIFNTITGDFEQELYGNHLIYRDNDVSTIVYSFWDEIYAYDGTLIADCGLEEDCMIYSLAFTDDGTQVVAEFLCTGSEAPTEAIYNLPK